MSIAILAARRRNATRAEAGEPEPDIRTTEPINWWSMLNAGYEPIRNESPFQHPDLPLIGAPWRVLQRGSQRIPVIKAGGQKLGSSKNRLYPKHEVRLVAYALLLEATNHIHVPYGLVFPVDSPHGLAFPITDELRTRALKMLRDLERTLADSQQRGTHPEIPGKVGRCANCDLGRPEKITESEIRNARKANEKHVGDYDVLGKDDEGGRDGAGATISGGHRQGDRILPRIHIGDAWRRVRARCAGQTKAPVPADDG